jgi:hypothetical protein
VQYKLGALPPVRPHVFSDLAAYAVGKLPTPPKEVAVPVVAQWGMDANDQYGCCAVAGGAHAINAWDVEVSENDAIPDADAVVAQYKALTGCVTAGDAHDTGLVLSDVLKLWQTVGLFSGNKIAAYAPVNHKVILDIHQAIAAYGAAYVGVALPESAEQQFAAGEPWTLEGDQPIGGHCILLVGYDPQWLYAVTWGAVVKISWAWWAYYATEAWAVIPQEFVEAGKGPRLDLDSLKADINTLNLPEVKKPWWDIF